MRHTIAHVAGKGDAAAGQLLTRNLQGDAAHMWCRHGILAPGAYATCGSARQDLMKIDPDRARDVRVTLVEAMQVSSTPV